MPKIKQNQIAEELGISKQDMSKSKNSINSLQKINSNHEQDITLYVANSQEVIEFANNIERCCQPVIDRIMR